MKLLVCMIAKFSFDMFNLKSFSLYRIRRLMKLFWKC
jgi:hypothetical protein